MSFKIADNITSPLGLGTDENVRNVLQGRSSLKSYEHRWDLPEPIMASLFSQEQRERLQQEGLTFFESAAAYSVEQALDSLGKDREAALKAARTAFVLSTTKGNVEQLATETEYILPSESADRIAARTGLTGDCYVVCNACISGLSALILADRLLDSGAYDYAVVCGIDVQSDFIVSGFQSFKALSAEECRPFDIERLGLNLGEAAATLILAARPAEGGGWTIADGAMSNDAYHISAPAKKGTGLQKVLNTLMEGQQPEEMAMINAHGTATMFNDQMEGSALRECGLTDIPVTGLKGYFGHTMGAAGVLETIVCMHALEQGIIPGTRGFTEIGVSGQLKISKEARETDKRQFIKLLSGFGGCNAGIRCVWNGQAKERTAAGHCTTLHKVRITAKTADIDGQPLAVEHQGTEMLKALYKTCVGDYPKFYKMDRTCQLGFVATELLLQAEGKERTEEREDRGVIFFNHHSTTDTDRKFYASISDKEAYYPSPSVFVYTLPNILTGEIAIRNHYQGETCHYLLPDCNEQTMQRVVEATFRGSGLSSLVTGWVDYTDETEFTADVQLNEYK